MPRRLTFRQRQLAALLLFAIIPMIIMLGFAMPAIQETIAQRTLDQLEIVADLRTVEVEQQLENSQSIARLLGEVVVEDLTHLGESVEGIPSSIDRILQASTKIFPDFLSVSLVDPVTKRIIYSTDPVMLERLRILEADAINAGASVFVGPVSYSIDREISTQTIALLISHEVSDLSDTILVIEFNVNNLQRVFDNLSGLGQTGRAYIVESNGFYVASSEFDKPNPLRVTAKSEGVKFVLEGQNGSGSYLDEAGQRILGVYRWLPQTRLGLLVEIKESELIADYRRIQAFVVAVEAILILLAIAAARSITQGLMQPLEEMANVARALQSGDLDQRVQELPTNDELGLLASSFNDMAASVQFTQQGLEQLVQQRTARLEAANRQLEREIEIRHQNTIAIQKSKDVLSHALMAANAGVWERNLSTQELVWSDENYKLLGLSREDVPEPSYERWLACLHPDDREAASNAVQQATAEGYDLDIEFRVVWPDGTIHWIYDAARIARDDEGNPTRIYGMQIDITKRKQIEEALRISEERYRTHFETAREGFTHTTVDGKILRANRAAAKILGYESPDDLRDMSIQAFYVNPDDRKMLVETLKWHGFIENVELLIKRRDGELIYVEISSNVERDESGAMQGIMAIFSDITQRKQTEERLLKTNRAYKLLSASSHALIHATEETAFLEEICKNIITSGYRLAWVGVALHDEERTVLPVAQAGYEEGYIETLKITWADTERGRGPTGMAIRTGEPFICQNTMTDPRFKPWRQSAIQRGYSSSLALPMINEGYVIGALNIYASEPNAFDHDEMNLLTILANDLAYGIQALRLRAAQREAEEELLNAHYLLEQAQRIAQIGSWEWDVATGAVQWSGESYRIFFVEPEKIGTEITTELYLSMIHPEDRDRVRSILKKGTTEKITTNFDCRIIRSDGEVRHIHVQGHPVLDVAGNQTQRIGVMHDITQRKQAEEALQRTNEELEQLVQERTKELEFQHSTLRTLLDTLPDAVYIKDRESRFIVANAQQAYIAGLDSPDDLIGKTDLELFPEHGAEYHADNQAVIESAESLLDKEEIIGEHIGELRWHLTSKVPLRNSDGEVIGIVGVGRDITERKRNAQALQEAHDELELRVEERTAELLEANRILEEEILERHRAQAREIGLANILESSLNEIYIFGIEALDFIFANRSALKNLSYSLEELQQLKAIDIKPDYSLESYNLLIQPVRSGEREIINFITRHQRKDGSTYPVEVYLQPSTFDEKPAFVAIVLDITERLQAEEELRKLSRAVEQSANSVIITDMNGIIEYTNPKFEEITGYSNAEVIGQTPAILKSGETPREIYDDLWDTITKGANWSGELRNKRKDGQLHWIYSSISSIRDVKGNVTHYLAIQQDVTERKAAEEALKTYSARLQTLSQQLMQAQEQERQRISRELHDEIGQALTALKISLEITTQTIPDTFPDIITRMHDLVELADTTLEQVRLVAQDLRPAALDTLGLVATLEGYCSEFSRRTQIPIQFEVNNTIPVLSDALRIAFYRILQESLTNMAKHSDASAGKVTIKHDVDHVTMSIVDNGRGIQEMADHAHGIGLAGMAERVELLGGIFEIKSVENQGTRITITIPTGEVI